MKEEFYIWLGCALMFLALLLSIGAIAEWAMTHQSEIKKECECK